MGIIKKSTLLLYSKLLALYCSISAIFIVILYHMNYRYLAMDTYSRSNISWNWSRTPFFLTNDGVWQPLPFIINGFIQRISDGFGLGTSSLWVGISINLLFSAIIALTVYDLTAQLLSKKMAWIVFFISISIPFYLYISFSGISEPIYISFILLAIRFLITYYSQKKKVYLYIASCMVLFATMTHMQGWIFLITYCFVMVALWYSEGPTVKKTMHYFTLIFIPCAFPITWIVLNYLKWKDAFYFLHATQQYETIKSDQAGILRLIENLITIEIMAPLIGVLFIISGIIIIKKRKSLSDVYKLYLVLVGLHLLVFSLPFLLKISSIDNSFSERRYLVLYILLVMPIAAFVFEYTKKSIVISTSIIIISFNCLLLPHFKNPYPPEVYSVSDYLKQKLSLNDWNRILIEKRGYAEQDGIPALTNMRESLIVMNQDELNGMIAKGTKDFLQFAKSKNISFVVSTSPDSVLALQQGANVIAQYGAYFVLELKNHELLVPPQPQDEEMTKWQSERSKSGVYRLSPKTYYMKFDGDIKKGSEIDIRYQVTFDANKQVVFQANINDDYGGDYMGRFVQQVYYDDILISNYDIGGNFFGWRELNIPFEGEKGNHTFRIVLKSLADQEAGWNWQDSSKMMVSNIKILQTQINE